MVDIIEVKNKLGNGCTIPYVVWCSDGNRYVAKFPGNPQGCKALVNEFIASRLCEYLNLPIMNYELINVKAEDYTNNMLEEMKPIVGTAFGTIYDDNLMITLNSDMISKSNNNYDAIKILIFDLLIGNYDRNKGNLMINPVSKKIIMIDHTHIFGLGTIWDIYQLPRLIDEKFDLNNLNSFNYSNLVNSLKYDETFYMELNKFIQKVKNISKEYINKIMEDIPNDWNVDKKEKELLTDYITKRFAKIEEILDIMNLKGGDNSEN